MVAVAAYAVSRKRLFGKPEKQQGRVNRQQNVNISSASPTYQISCNKCGKQHEQENVLHITKPVMSVGTRRYVRPTREFSIIWKQHHCRGMAAKFDLCSVLMAVE